VGAWELIKSALPDTAWPPAYIAFLKSTEAKGRLLGALPVEDLDSAIAASILAVAEFERESAPASGCLVLAARALGLAGRPIALRARRSPPDFSLVRAAARSLSAPWATAMPAGRGATAARIRRGVPAPSMSSLSDVLPV